MQTVTDNRDSDITTEVGGIVTLHGIGGNIKLSAEWASGEIRVVATGRPVVTLSLDDLRDIENGINFLRHVATRAASEAR